MHWWFSLRIGVVAIVMALAYAPFVWFAAHLGVPLPAIIGSIIVVLGIQYYLGTKRALRESNATRLEELESSGHPIKQYTQELAYRLDVPEPTLWISNMGSPNAFAIGRKGNGHIVLDAALLNILSTEEVQAVIAHELSHLRSRDVIPMVIGSGAATLMYYFLAIIEDLFRTQNRQSSLAGGFGHTIMMCFVFAISREREYLADADAKWAMGSGEHLANALAKIEQTYETGQATEPPDGVEAFCISGHWSLPALGSTHPSTVSRVTRLRDSSP